MTKMIFKTIKNQTGVNGQEKKRNEHNIPLMVFFLQDRFQNSCCLYKQNVVLIVSMQRCGAA